MTYFKNNIASLFGVKSAVVAQYLFDNIFVMNEGYCIAKREGKAWCRCSKVHLTSVFPFYSRHQISDAIDILIEGKGLKKKPFDKNRFDHTNWYAFTEYGLALMTKNDGGI